MPPRVRQLNTKHMRDAIESAIEYNTNTYNKHIGYETTRDVLSGILCQESLDFDKLNECIDRLIEQKKLSKSLIDDIFRAFTKENNPKIPANIITKLFKHADGGVVNVSMLSHFTKLELNQQIVWTDSGEKDRIIKLIADLLKKEEIDKLRIDEIGSVLYHLYDLVNSKFIQTNNLDQLLRNLIDAIDNHADLTDFCCRDLCGIIGGLHLLKRKNILPNNLKIKAKLLDALLGSLTDLPNILTASRIIYGLGSLSKNHITGEIKFKFCDWFCEITTERKKIKQGMSEAVVIGNIFLGLGFMANNGLTNEVYDVEMLANLQQIITNTPTNTNEISFIYYGLGLLAQNKKVRGAVDVKGLNDLPEFTNNEACINAIYGIALFNLAIGMENVSATDKIKSELLWKNTSSYVSGKMDRLNIESINQFAIATALLGYIIPENIKNRLSENYRNPSTTQINIANAIHDKGIIDVECEKLIEAWHVDIYFEYQGRKFIIELDGEQHYRNDKLRQQDIIRDKILTDDGYTVLRIRNYKAQDVVDVAAIILDNCSNYSTGDNNRFINLAERKRKRQDDDDDTNGANKSFKP